MSARLNAGVVSAFVARVISVATGATFAGTTSYSELSLVAARILSINDWYSSFSDEENDEIRSFTLRFVEVGFGHFLLLFVVVAVVVLADVVVVFRLE